jgi:hypothetical protein
MYSRSSRAYCIAIFLRCCTVLHFCSTSKYAVQSPCDKKTTVIIKLISITQSTTHCTRITRRFGNLQSLGLMLSLHDNLIVTNYIAIDLHFYFFYLLIH